MPFFLALGMTRNGCLDVSDDPVPLGRSAGNCNPTPRPALSDCCRRRAPLSVDRWFRADQLAPTSIRAQAEQFQQRLLRTGVQEPEKT